MRSMITIQAATLRPPFGSFEFSPEGYAKASYWLPEDGFTWDDYSKLRFSSLEELEAKRAEFEVQVSGKTEIVNDHYYDGSLRRLLPNRWLVAYTRDKAWKEVGRKKVPLYSQLKRTLFFKSIILGYGEGPLKRSAPSKEVARYIKEQCASSARLKAIALRAYESAANIRGYSTWSSVCAPVFMCLAAAKSSLDAMSAVLWALLFQETPTGKKLPSMSQLYVKLQSKGGHPFLNEFAKLHKSSWFTRLQLARDSVVHRSANPVVHDKFGVGFDFDLGLFKEMRPNKIHVGKPRSRMEENTKLIHLDKIMKGFVVGLENWEKKVARKLHKIAWFPSFNTDGILMGIEFNDFHLLMDGTGPSHLISSHAQGIGSAFQFIGLHPFVKKSKPARTKPAPSAPVKSWETQ